LVAANKRCEVYFALSWTWTASSILYLTDWKFLSLSRHLQFLAVFFQQFFPCFVALHLCLPICWISRFRNPFDLDVGNSEGRIGLGVYLNFLWGASSNSLQCAAFTLAFMTTT
jgi:hypothetical protein